MFWYQFSTFFLLFLLSWYEMKSNVHAWILSGLVVYKFNGFVFYLFLLYSVMNEWVMAKKYRKENSNSSVTRSICIITCGLSNRSIDWRLEYSSFIMPEPPPFPLPPSIGHCCEMTECGGGESSMQWHWLSWHCANVTWWWMMS